ncbi:pleckstrin homology-like domain family A member 3 [Clupea harengus]|uniref:Pleckstrin homology-like domain family A member 3 n=1 Tax=Clupea harengus TaxID=7950 RepID=A0A8M1KKE3_CLUHA|nr:pleckstrin homology-like domain family A member 3 [Clupea harengus]
MNPIQVMKEGHLEKRSNGLLQLWKKKRCLMTEDGLHLYDYKCKDTTAAPGLKEKQIPFEHMVTVDCVENKRGLVYFTIVMSGGKEIDFRCQQEGTAWNAEIALALVRFKNRLAVQTGKNRYLHQSSSDEDFISSG